MSTLPTARPTQGVAMDHAALCAGCAAPLAPDQLFCLSCGTRRRDARIAFRDVLASEAAPVIVNGSGAGGGDRGPGGWAPVPVAGGPAPAGSYTPFIATLAVLLLALGVGVWIGRSQQAPIAAAAPATLPVAASVAAPVETTPTDEAEAAPSDTTEDDAAEADEAASESAESAASNADIKKLEQLSPEAYQEQSQKLPKEVGTGGTAPPKDDKPAGGGSEFESFE